MSPFQREKPGVHLAPGNFGFGDAGFGVALGAGVGVPFAQTAAILGAGGLDYAFFTTNPANGLFQDIAGTLPAAIGNPVARWDVFQKPPHTAQQPVSAQRGVLQSDGKKYDGSDDNDLTDWLAQSGANCIIAQVTVPLGTSGRWISGSNGPSSGERFGLYINGDGRAGFGWGTVSPVTATGGPDLRGASVTVALSATGANGVLKGFVETAEVYSGVASGDRSAVANTIGVINANGTLTAFFPGAIKRIAFGKTALTLEQFQTIRAEWLAAA